MDERIGSFMTELDPFELLARFRKIHKDIFYYKIKDDSEDFRVYIPLTQIYLIYPDVIKKDNVTISADELISIVNQFISSGKRHIFQAKIPYHGGVVFYFDFNFKDSWTEFLKNRGNHTDNKDTSKFLGYICLCDYYYCYDIKSKMLYCVNIHHNDSEVSNINFEELLNPNITMIRKVDIEGQAIIKRQGIDILDYIDTAKYSQQFMKIMDYFKCKEISQLILSACIDLPYVKDEIQYFSDISRRYGDAIYSYYFSIGDQSVFGNCSLTHVLIEKNTIKTRILASTNSIHEKLCLNKEKYQTEHDMLVDEDLIGLEKLTRPNTIKFIKRREPLQIGSTVYLSSEISGELFPGYDLLEVILSMFPRGAVTGAPKEKAYHLINQIEDRPRGFYTGCMGIFDFMQQQLISNSIVTCVVSGENKLRLQAGCGLTGDSELNRELKELSFKLIYLFEEILKYQFM